MRKWIVILLVFFVLVKPSFSKDLSVSTSIFILSSIVKEIGGSRVDVSYVVPASANPHIFSPTPRDLLNFAKADLFIGVGYDFEFWFRSVSYLRRGKVNIFLSKFYRNPIGRNGRYNPHIWLDIGFIRTTGIKEIVNEMCKLDRKDCRYFKNNANILKRKMGAIVGRYNSSIGEALKNYCIVDLKPAFEYFLRNLKKRSCDVVIKEGVAMPSVKDIGEIKSFCKCEKGIVIYINRRSLANSIAEMLGYRIVELNPLGDPSNPKENDYVKLLEYDLSQIEKAVK